MAVQFSSRVIRPASRLLLSSHLPYSVAAASHFSTLGGARTFPLSITALHRQSRCITIDLNPWKRGKPVGSPQVGPPSSGSESSVLTPSSPSSSVVSDPATLASSASPSGSGGGGGLLFPPGWSPSELVADFLQYMHVSHGVPVWVTTIAMAVVIRWALFPLLVYNKRLGLYLALSRPISEEFSRAMMEKRNAQGGIMTKPDIDMIVAQRDIEYDKVMPGLRPSKPFKALVPMIAIQLMFFNAFRHYFMNVSHGDRFGWITDLAAVDPFLTAPLATIFGLTITLQIRAVLIAMLSGMNGPSPDMVKRGIKLYGGPTGWWMFLAIPCLAGTMAFIPSGMVLYFTSSAVMILSQTYILDNKAMRKKLEIPILSEIPASQWPQAPRFTTQRPATKPSSPFAAASSTAAATSQAASVKPAPKKDAPAMDVPTSSPISTEDTEKFKTAKKKAGSSPFKKSKKSK